MRDAVRRGRLGRGPPRRRDRRRAGRRLARARLPEGLDGIDPAARADRRAPARGLGRPGHRSRSRRGWWSGSRPTGARGWRRWSRPATRCSRSTRCRWPGTGSGTRPRGRSPTPAMRTCWPRSSAWTAAHHRPVAGDSAEVEALKLVARTHQSLIWDRHPARAAAASGAAGVLPRRPGGLRSDLDAARRAGAARAGPRTRTGPPGCRRSKITAALTRARRRDVEAKAERDPGRAARPGAAPAAGGRRPPTPRSWPARSG